MIDWPTAITIGADKADNEQSVVNEPRSTTQR